MMVLAPVLPLVFADSFPTALITGGVALVSALLVFVATIRRLTKTEVPSLVLQQQQADREYADRLRQQLVQADVEMSSLRDERDLAIQSKLEAEAMLRMETAYRISLEKTRERLRSELAREKGRNHGR